MLEIVLLGGAAAIALFVLIQLARIRPICLQTLAGVAFAAGSAIYFILELDGMGRELGWPWYVANTFGSLTPVFFWLFIISLVDDEFRWKPWMAAPFAILFAVQITCYFLPDDMAHIVSRIFRLPVVIALVGHMIWRIARSYSDDLVDSRRSFSMAMMWVVAFVSLAIVGVEFYKLSTDHPVWMRDMHAASMLVAALIVAVNMTSISEALLPTGALHPAQLRQLDGLSAADMVELERLQTLIENRAFLKPGLTIGSLATQVGVPEHRLRRLINQSLGYRNFAAFINDHRIAEAKTRLANRELAREQITGLAFDLGFASLAPFNRAFRERVGMSPSEFRERALSVSFATSPTADSAGPSAIAGSAPAFPSPASAGKAA